MNLLFLLNNDKYAAKAFAIMLPKLSEHNIKILLSQSFVKKNSSPKELQKLAEIEKYEFNWQEKFSTEAKFCDNINSQKTITEIKKFNPDLIISIRFNQILQQAIIDIPSFGVLNLHSGILPNYRGVMASFWAILNGEKNLGTTLHYIQNSTIDTGDIIAFSSGKIDYELSFLENVNNLYDEGSKLILGAIKKISLQEKIKTIKQSELGSGRYFSYPKSTDIEKFLHIMKLV